MTFDATERRGAGAEAARAAHDEQPPANLISFMLRDWQPARRDLPSPVRHAAGFAARRERLARRFAGEILIIPTGHRAVRANDEYFPFRAGSDFFYLTGNLEPDCVLALVPDGDAHRAVLFVEPNPGRTDARFFTDRENGELWEGARLGVVESAARHGIGDVRALGELPRFCADVVSAQWKMRLLRGLSPRLESLLAPASVGARDAELATVLSEMRLIKDAHELDELRRAVDATRRGFEDVIARLPTAGSERELEGVFFTRARMEGNGTGYGSVVAAGAHACTLHWRKNDGALRAGELVLVDAGVEGESLYTADITRTLPLAGRFTREQREVYALVHAAQAAALAQVRPGNDFLAPNRAAMRVLAHGLEQLRVLRSAEEALADENQFYRRYSLHNVSHMLGLDVHDCAKARQESYKLGPLVAGMVLTVEPGLYFQPDDLTVPPRYRGIGVRIEDDVVVTEGGYENLSASIPSAPDEVERWIEQIWSRPRRARDA